MKKRIFSLFLVLCFTFSFAAAASASLVKSVINILTSDSDGVKADGYDYNEKENPKATIRVGDEELEFDDLTLGFVGSGGSLSSGYFFVGEDEDTGDLNKTYDLGNGLTAKIKDISGGKKATLSLSGTPTTEGEVSFVVTRSESSSKIASAKTATFTITISPIIYPSTKAPTISNPTMPTPVHGRAFNVSITATDNYDVEAGEYVNISIVDPDDIENDDESVVYLSSEELSETYGITAEMSGDSTLVLAADKVASPTPIDKTVKFRVSTYNDYTNTDEYAADHDGSKVVTKDFTLKFTAISPKIASVHVAKIDATKLSGTNLGTYPIAIAEDDETEGDSIKAKNKKIKKNGDDEEETPAVRVYFKTNKTTAIPEAETQGDNEDDEEEETEQILKVSDLPDGLTFTLYQENKSDDLTVRISEFVYVLEGNPTKAGTFNITVTPSNSVYNVKDNAIRYSLTVVDAPSIKSPTLDKGLTAITFGSKYNGTSISLNGGNRDHSPSISKVEVLTDSDLKELPSFLSVDKSNKFIVSSTNSTFDSLAQVNALKTALGVEDEVVDGFGDKGEVTLNLQFTFSCDVFAENVIPVESRSVVIKTIKPAFTNTSKNQTSAQTKINNASLKAGTAISATIELEASAPGNIIWSYDKLPDGIKLSAGTDDADTDTKSITPDKSGLKSAVTITGTPTTPAKNYSTTIRAHNGAGYTDVKLTFNIAAPTPEIAYKVKGDNGYSEYDGDWTPFSGDKKVGEEVDIIVYNKAPNSGATKFTAKLPGGLTLKKVDGADSDRQARITGKYNKAATNATIEITAEDQDSAAKPKVTAKLTGVNIYAMPKISTSKLNDLTVGKFDIVTVAGDGVSKWYVSASTVNQKPDTEITTETPIGIGGIYSADIETNDRTGVSTLKLGRTLSTIPSETEQTIRIWAENFADVVSKDLKFKVKGEKVKITTTKLNDCYPTEAGETKIEFTGSPAIDSIAYISENDAKSAGLNDGEIIMLTGTEATDYKISYANGKIKKGENTPLHKGIKITVSADNGLGEAKKVYTLVIKGMDPKWLYGTGDDQENVTGKTMGTGKGTKDYEKNLITYDVSKASSEFLTLTVSGDKPFEITNTTLPKGITADVTSSDTENPTVKISYAVNEDAKPGNNKVTFTAKNTATGKSAKVTVVLTALQAPNISNKEALETGKEVEGGKKLSLKATLNPADKSATWAIISADLPLNHSIITDAAQIKDKFGIEIDQKGVIGGTTKGVTSTDSGADFMKLLIKVANDAGEDYAYANVKIKGSKPKIDSKTKQFTFVRGVELTDANVSEDNRIVKAQGIDSLDIVMTEEGSGLSDLGLSISPRGVITGTPTAGTKGTNVTIKANHFGAEANLKVKIIVNDPEATLAPDGVTLPITFNATLTDKGKVEEKDEQEITVKLSSAATQVPQWKIAAKPNYSGVTVKITEKNEESATILITLKKNAAARKSGDIYPTIHTSFKISATNKSNKKVSITDPISVDISFGQDPTTETEEAVNETSDVKEADKKENELVEEELTKELGEGDLSIGAERTESALTDEQKAAIKAEGYMIAAILPEISATVDGQYGLEVDLLADVPAGSELKWLAYPQSPAEPSTDDEIADFFDIDGADTTTAPADHIVLVYPWLREGVKYAPVIVAKVSEAAPGDVVSEEGLDEAVEKAKEGEESTEEIVLDEEGKTTEAPAENQDTTTETPVEEPANDESKPEETSTEAQSE